VGDIAFYNGSNRVVDSELVGGKSPGTGVGNVAFYDGSGRVADSQLLDGVDGSGYSVVAHTHAYLSTSGGTISGSLVISNDLTVTSTINANGNVNLGQRARRHGRPERDRHLGRPVGRGPGVRLAVLRLPQGHHRRDAVQGPVFHMRSAA
jgi:hypothetical protein